MINERLLYKPYHDLVMSADEAAKFFEDRMIVGSSGFTKAGDSKAVIPALARRAQNEKIGITLITGASLGYSTDGDLAAANALYKRMPFQSDPTLRGKINTGETYFIDQHLSETAELLANGHLPAVELAVIEATMMDEEGNIVPTTSVGNSATFVQQAKQIIIEINMTVPTVFRGVHDVLIPESYPNRKPYEISKVDDRIGETMIKIDPSKVVGIVFTEMPDASAAIAAPDEVTTAIADHLLNFFDQEVKLGRLTKSLLPLQAGIGKVANAVLTGFIRGDFENLTMYSEVLQDSTFDLFDSGKMTFASASSFAISDACYERVVKNFDNYKDKMVLRPQNISNAAEIVRRLGIIGINTAIEFDMYGNVNSTHIAGTKMMNGIGGSGDFARNAYLSIFVCPSLSKGGAISHVVPMVSHTDHTEHDVDILVTENGLADLRGLAPRERAQVIIDNCVHPEYREKLQSYFDRAKEERGGQTPHILEEALSWHVNLTKTGSMKG